MHIDRPIKQTKQTEQIQLIKENESGRGEDNTRLPFAFVVIKSQSLVL